MSVTEFERRSSTDIVVRRLQALITAGVTVGDQEVRDTYRKQNIKIKFDYAVISSDDLRKTINPSDSDLQASSRRTPRAMLRPCRSSARSPTLPLRPTNCPAELPQPSQQEIQQYFTAHQSEYSVPEQARSRHILIKVGSRRRRQGRCRGQGQGRGLLKQIQGGANFADLAKKNSDDPGSKDKGGELGFAQRGMHGAGV
jgi:peptidyl-prolyl cis-trans isomerase D